MKQVMMTPDMIAKLKRSLIKHEGIRKFPYLDSIGKITIGIGYNLSDRGLDDNWINTQYSADVSYFFSLLSMFSWFNDLNEDRQIVLIDMCFMGYKKLMQFTKMIDALKEKNYEKAAEEILDSKWAREVKGRAKELAEAMKTGVYSI